jgi:hypothetical protein
MASRILTTWLKELVARPSKRRKWEPKHRPRSAAPRPEQLEDRTVPTVVFNSALGGDTIIWRPDGHTITAPLSSNPTVLNDPQVYFIFWGTSWNTTNAGASAGDAQMLINSGFLSQLTDYGSDGIATYAGYTIDNSAAPSTVTADVTTTEIQDVLGGKKSVVFSTSSWTRPGASAVDSPIYVVVYDTGSDPGFFSGLNLATNYSVNQVMNQISITDPQNDVGGFTETLSHEIIERISDGTGNGIGMNAVNAGTDCENVNGQISDNEPDGFNYTYRLNGSLLVQAYWSLAYKAFVVPDGNVQVVKVSPVWTHSSTPQYGNKMCPSNYKFTDSYGPLEIDGDQLGLPYSDSITLDQTGSGGVKVTLNGETFQFDSGQISAVNVDTGDGNDTVHVLQTIQNVPVNVDLGIGQDNVVVMPPSGLQQIQGPVNVLHLGGGTCTLTVDDGGNSKSASWTLADSSINSSAAMIAYQNVQNLNVNGGSGDDTFQILQIPPVTAAAINGGGGTNTLTYAAYTGDVTVDIPLGVATGLSGGISNIQKVYGSIGNDLLVGDANTQLLSGGTLRNIIISGAGTAQVFGGGDDEILIAGTTDYDQNLTALGDFMTEWLRTDLTFQQRVADIKTGGASVPGNLPPSVLDGTGFELDGKTVHANQSVNVLTGSNGSGNDWFFWDPSLDTLLNTKDGDHYAAIH